MKGTRINFLWALIVIILISGMLVNGCRQSHENRIDELFAEFDRPGVPGAAVLVARKGEIICQKGYGFANLETGERVTEHTNFRLASMTKQFTAMCIMMLKERGFLSYEDTMTDIFPGFPPYGSAITVRHLLTHTSGIISYENLMPEEQTEQLHDRDVLAYMTAQDSTYFTPGTQYRYSNSGYAVLAMIVERISGTRFADFLHDNIFAPLGMLNTVAYEKGISTVPNRAMGYRENDEGRWVDSDQSLTSAVLGDGGIYTSLADYFKWERALHTDKLVSRETLEEAFTSALLADGTETGYGFGWEIEAVNGRRIIRHAGGTCGFSTYVLRIPDEEFVVVFFTNRPGIDSRKYAYDVAGLFEAVSE